MFDSSDDSAQLAIQIAAIVGVLLLAVLFLVDPGEQIGRTVLQTSGGAYLCDGDDCQRVEALQLSVLGNGQVQINGKVVATRAIPDVVRYEKGLDAPVTVRVVPGPGATARDTSTAVLNLARAGIPPTSIRVDGLPAREPR